MSYKLVKGISRYRRGEVDDLCIDMISGLLYQMTCRRLDPPDDLFDAGESTDPMRCVSQVCAGDAGKEVFRTAREPGNFVRHGRAEYEDQVVVQDQLVYRQIDALR